VQISARACHPAATAAEFFAANDVRFVMLKANFNYSVTD
jgi:hypothetical protein